MTKIKAMTAHTNIKTGKTKYYIYYKSGKIRKTIELNENWPTSAVIFFTDENTVRTEDRIIVDTEGKPSARYERFENTTL